MCLLVSPHSLGEYLKILVVIVSSIGCASYLSLLKKTIEEEEEVEEQEEAS